jgi:hypothetical protein
MSRTGKNKLVRTTITLPASLKDKMDKTDTNWSEAIREMIAQRLEEEGGTDMAEAIILNERIRRPAPVGWSAENVIKQWRRRRRNSSLTRPS